MSGLGVGTCSPSAGKLTVMLRWQQGPPSGTPSGRPMGSRWSRHRPSSTRARARPSGSGPRPRGAATRHSPSARRRSCVQPSRPSWPACPAPRSPGLTSDCWSSQPGAATTRWSLTVQPAWRTRRPRIRPPRSAPGAPVRLPRGVLAAAHRSPRSARLRVRFRQTPQPRIAVHVRRAAHKATTQRGERAASLRRTGWRRRLAAKAGAPCRG
jgi:hypothetical protein